MQVEVSFGEVGGGGGGGWATELPALVWAKLTALRGSAGRDVPVFPGRRGGDHLDQTAVLRIVRKAAKRAGLAEGATVR